MKLLSLCLGLLFAVVTQLSQAAEMFEGLYEMELSGEGERNTMVCWTKEGHIRMKLANSAMPGEMIMRDGMQTMLVIMPEQRMYLEMPVRQGASSAPAEKPESEEIPFKKTGETKEILGLTAHEFTMDTDQGKLVVWATDELGSMPLSRNPMMKSYESAMRQVTGLKAFFPLETVGYKGDKVSYRMVVKKVEKKELEDSLFAPPAGFTKMTMPAGMGGMMGR